MNGVLAWAMAVFFVAAFALPGAAAYGLVFYVCVCPALVLGVRRLQLPGAGDAWALALIAWSGLTLVWGDDPAHRAWRFWLATLATGAFFLALRGVLEHPRGRARLTTVLIWAGTANAVMALLISSRTLLAGGRILGWGITRQPILGGSVMAVCLLTALARAVAAREWRTRAAYLAACVVMVGFVLAMQSRGALLAAGLAAMFWVAAGPWRWRALAAIGVAAAGWVFLAPAEWRDEAARLLLARGTSHRLEIWRQSLAAIRQKPFFGHGLADYVPPDSFWFPHSLYLSLVYYSGLVGLALFLGLGVAAAQALARRRGDGGLCPACEMDETGWIAALGVNALAAGMTDFGQITKGPGELWVIFWLPVALALSRPDLRTPISAPGAAWGLRAPARR